MIRKCSHRRNTALINTSKVPVAHRINSCAFQDETTRAMKLYRFYNNTILLDLLDLGFLKEGLIVDKYA